MTKIIIIMLFNISLAYCEDVRYVSCLNTETGDEIAGMVIGYSKQDIEKMIYDGRCKEIDENKYGDINHANSEGDYQNTEDE